MGLLLLPFSGLRFEDIRKEIIYFFKCYELYYCVIPDLFVILIFFYSHHLCPLQYLKAVQLNEILLARIGCYFDANYHLVYSRDHYNYHNRNHYEIPLHSQPFHLDCLSQNDFQLFTKIIER